jgi:predicted PurR-regulated permease PerM
MKKRSRPPAAPPASNPAAVSPPDGTHDAPSLAAIVAATFNRLNLRMRARMLGRLLASVGPLALTVVGGGAFAKYVAHARWQEIPVSIDDAARATSSQIYDIVRYVEQSDPQLYSQLLNVLARDSATIAALGASIAALTLNRLTTRSGTGYPAANTSRFRPTGHKPGSTS